MTRGRSDPGAPERCDATAARTSARREAERRVERIRWPDGPVCPYCGERERVVPGSKSGESRVRYECPACQIHRGFVRRPGPPKPPTGGTPPPIAPGFPV